MAFDRPKSHHAVCQYRYRHGHESDDDKYGDDGTWWPACFWPSDTIYRCPARQVPDNEPLHVVGDYA